MVSQVSETLREKQSRFVRDVVKLLDHAHKLGYDLTFGETYRTPEQAEINARRGTGIRMSLHTQRLAIDINLFRAGVYLDMTDHHKGLGTFWKSLGPDHRWGGDFRKPDGNHYSIEHGGRS